MHSRPTCSQSEILHIITHRFIFVYFDGHMLTGTHIMITPDPISAPRASSSPAINSRMMLAGAQIMITVLINLAVTCLPVFFDYPMQLLMEAWARRFAVTQSSLDRTFEGPEFELASRYGALLSALLVSLRSSLPGDESSHDFRRCGVCLCAVHKILSRNA